MFKEVSTSAATQRVFVCGVHAVIFACSGIAAFLLRLDFSLLQTSLRSLDWALVVWIGVKTIVFQLGELDRLGLRYVSLFDMYRLIIANVIGSIISCAVILAITQGKFPMLVYLIDLILSFLGTAGLSAVLRTTSESIQSGRSRSLEKRTFIYGAGDAGMTLLREIRNNPKLAYRVIGLLDDAVEKQGLRVNGVKVLGGADKIEALVTKYRVETILIAMPSTSGVEMARILGACHAARVHCMTVPGLGEIIKSHEFVGQIREVSFEDLLGRTQIRLEDSRIRETIEGKMVIVTGAAGSIGSELCRQIARFSPAGIVGFEIAESPLFEVDREMFQTFPQVRFFPVIGSIQNRNRLSDVFRQYRPAVVYHAAAYKHVPLMETDVFEAVENNVFGTVNVADMAADYGVETFVMISSDKAVRPTNVMGATKRIAELLMMARQNGGTQYVAVRFGNVLGSNGSVVPIFKKQIAAGGPVTVTHPEMQRFFMTISEACQLVLQTTAIGEGGQICVLDMGQPVKIVDLARNLILFSGLRPDSDIKLEFIGMRPGEKLHEELGGILEDTLPSGHERIRIFAGNGMPDGDVRTWLESLQEICHARDVERLVVALKEIVVDYNPSTHLLKCKRPEFPSCF